jgi:ABC-type antimicrobial peptide transport system permease subunit
MTFFFSLIFIIFKKKFVSIYIIILSIATMLFIITLFFYHIKFTARNISTYANLKMKDVFILFGNPFSRKNCKKNCYLTLCQKYHKRINFKAKINLKNLDEKNDSPSFISINNLNNSNVNENNKSNISNNNNENNNNNNFNILILHKNKNNDY